MLFTIEVIKHETMNLHKLSARKMNTVVRSESIPDGLSMEDLKLDHRISVVKNIMIYAAILSGSRQVQTWPEVVRIHPLGYTASNGLDHHTCHVVLSEEGKLLLEAKGDVYKKIEKRAADAGTTIASELVRVAYIGVAHNRIMKTLSKRKRQYTCLDKKWMLTRTLTRLDNKLGILREIDDHVMSCEYGKMRELEGAKKGHRNDEVYN